MPDKFEPSSGGAFGPGLDYNTTGDWRFLGSLEAGDLVVSRDGSVNLQGVALIAIFTPVSSNAEVPVGQWRLVITGDVPNQDYKLVHNRNGTYIEIPLAEGL